MLLPNIRFQLLKPKTVAILRYGAGSIVKGKWVKGTTSTINAECIMYPVIKKSDKTFLPEQIQDKKVYRLHTNTKLKDFQDGAVKQQADELDISGERYRVVKIGEWEDVGGHTSYEVYVARVDSELLALYGG